MRPSHGTASGVERLRRHLPLSGWVGVVAWLGTRSVMALVLATLCLFVREDVGYYAVQLQSVPMLRSHGLGGTLVEYPVPAVWLLEALRVPAGASSAVYVYAFALLMVLLDTVCCWALWRHHSRLGALLWIGFTFCIGPLLWFRIDLVPAVCVLVAAHQRNRRPVLSGAAVGLGAAMKLWPALLVLPLLGADRAGRRRGLGLVGLGGALGALSWLAEGWTRSVSPLGWQNGRGLQVESVWATPLMAARLVSDGWHVRLSRYNAYEVFGPGVPTLVRLASGSMLVVVGLGLVLCWLIGFGGAGLPGHRMSAALAPERRRDRDRALLLGLVAMICAVIVADKTFSPQYMIWLTGPFAVLSSAQWRSGDRRRGAVLVVMTLCCAALTQLVFPLNYSALVRATDPGVAVSVLLVARNALMCVLAGHSAAQALSGAWRLGRPAPAHLPSSTQPDDEEPHA